MNFKSLAIACSSLILTAYVSAQPKLIESVAPQQGKLIIPYDKYELGNGLTVILHEDHSDPIVHVNVTYHVGSARETPGKSGFAHFFEHMMFQGSDHVADDEHFKIVQKAGGDMNGTTNRDRTNYFETLPSNYLETALWLEADRMGFLLDAVTSDAFENQRSTVKNEKGQNYLSRPYGTVGEINDQNFYPKGHPYSWPTIGYTDDLDRANENDLKNFFLRWYGPNNAILTISGDIDKKKTLDLAVKYFGGIKQGPVVKKQVVPKPIIPNDKYSTIEDDIHFPFTQMVYSSVPNYHKDEAPIDMLADIMGDGNNSVFYKNFVKSEKAVQASVSNPCFELAGEFTIEVFAYPDQTLEETEQLIRKTIDEFEQNILMGPDIEDKLNQARNNLKTQIISGSESILGKSIALSQWHMLLGRPYNLQDDLDRYDAVTKEDLVRVFNKYIKDKKAVITNVVAREPKPGEEDFEKKSYNPYANEKYPDPPEYAGLKYVKADDKFDRSVKPSPNSPKTAVVPSHYNKELNNGVKIIGTKTEPWPITTIYMTIKGGHIMDEGNYHDGTSHLTALMMNEGTEKKTTEEVSAALSRLGSNLRFSADDNSTNISVTCLTSRIDETLAILEEKLFHPRFAEDDFKRTKKRALQGIKNQRTNPTLTAFKSFNNIMYGNTVLGRYYTGSYETVDKIKIDDVKSFYNNNYAPGLTNVVIVSELDEAAITSKLQFLDKWAKKEVKMPEIKGFPEYEGPQILLVDKPAAPHSQICIGYLATPYDYNGTFFKSTVMNFAMGGNFSSRINLNLREDKGYTYGARSWFSGSEYRGPFTAFASVGDTVTDLAVKEFMTEIKNYRENGITDDELEFTKSSLLLNDILNYETSFQKAIFLNNIVRYNLPDDYISQQEKIIGEMTRTEINQLAKEYLKTEKMVILIVGNAYFIKKNLDKLGYGKVKEVDANSIKLKEFKM